MTAFLASRGFRTGIHPISQLRSTGAILPRRQRQDTIPRRPRRPGIDPGRSGTWDTLAMDALFTKADLDRLIPAPRTREAERAEAQFLAALRVRDAILAALGLPLALVARLSAWADRRRTALELERLSDRELADIGLSRYDIGRLPDRAEIAHGMPAPRRLAGDAEGVARI